MSRRRATMPDTDGSAPDSRLVDASAGALWRSIAAWLGRCVGLRLSVVLALLLGLAMPQAWFMMQDGRSAEARALETLRADLDQVTDILAAAMRDPLWQISPDLGRPLLQAMFRDERLVAVVVHEAKGEAPFLDIYRSVSATAPSLSRTRAIVFDGRELGSIRVTMSAAPALARHERELETFTLRLLSSTLVAVLLVLAVLHWRLSRPLGHLLQRLRAPAGPGRAGDWQGVEELRPLVEEIERRNRPPDGGPSRSGQ